MIYPHTEAAERHEQRVAARTEATGWSLPPSDFTAMRRHLKREFGMVLYGFTHDEILAFADVYEASVWCRSVPVVRAEVIAPKPVALLPARVA